MDIETAKSVIIRTHLSALRHSVRASGIVLEGMPGIAKTEGAFQSAELLAREVNEPVGVVQFMLATIASVDVKGFLIPVKNPNSTIPDTVFSRPPWMPTNTTMHVVTPDGKWFGPGEWTGDVPRVGILFLDEWSQADEEVKKPAAELIYKGNVGECRLKADWRVLAAGNRTSDRSGVGRELMFIVNRRLLLRVEGRLPQWRDWANGLPDAKRPHYMTVSFAEKNPNIVFPDKVPDGTDPFCTPRSLVMMDRDLRALQSAQDIANDRLPMDATSRELCAGWVGEAAAAQYFTHLRYAEELPDIDDIVRKPGSAKLPSKIDAQMVCAYMLAHHVNDNTAAPIVDYVKRLDIKMQVLAFSAFTKSPHRADVLAVPAAQLWLKENKDLLTSVNA